ncbi:MAG TPA: hypothetical protein VFO80_12415 [Sphingomonas sp.]|nr:hypothetical protein [Sphingomonas sp.]
MTLRHVLAAAALIAAPAAQAADPSPAAQATDVGSRVETGVRGTAARKIERKQPGIPTRPRIIDAPGAALMMIPAAWDPEQATMFRR